MCLVYVIVYFFTVYLFIYFFWLIFCMYEPVKDDSGSSSSPCTPSLVISDAMWKIINESVERSLRGR